MGSEMCIRDRVLDALHHRPGDLGVDKVLAGVDGEREGQISPVDRLADDRVCLCLLYTSDAADERSSVDLGGRRIIKKKTIKKKKRSRNARKTKTWTCKRRSNPGTDTRTTLSTERQIITMNK